MRLARFSSLLPLAMLAACSASSGDRPRVGRTVVPADWRNVATPADRDRLREARDTWLAALAEARVGHAADIRQQGALFDPDRALAGAAPPVGAYRCRVFKLGSKAGDGLSFVAYPFFDCRIDNEGEVLSFYKATGSQRPVGLIFKDSDQRGIFIGTLVLGDETSAMQYGQDASRDMVGMVERVGERRWRLSLPAPAFESKMDVVELIPAES